MSTTRMHLLAPALAFALAACQVAGSPAAAEVVPTTPVAAAREPAPADAAELARQVFDLARAGDRDALARVLQPGFPFEMRNGRGDTLLILTAYYGHGPVVDLLLERGASADGTNDQGNTALMGACFKGDVDVVERLIRHGAGVVVANSAGQTALMFAALFDHGDVAARLIAAGADPDRADGAGRSARMLARAQGAQSALAAMAP